MTVTLGERRFAHHHGHPARIRRTERKVLSALASTLTVNGLELLRVSNLGCGRLT
jgi:hypothetical protein